MTYDYPEPPAARHGTVGAGAAAVTFGNDRPFVLISGPCQIEGRDHALFMAEALARVAAGAGVPFVFK